MQDFEVGAIVPSTRDLLQVVTTRRRGLAVVARVGDGDVAATAARLDELGVSALALAAPGPDMQVVARATKTVPVLSLGVVVDRDGCLRARYFGADAVCVDAAASAETWDAIARQVRTTRMLPVALARGAEEVARAVQAGARAVLLQATQGLDVPAITATLPRNVTLLVEPESALASALSALRGHADAVLVPPALHETPAFAELVATLDP